MQNHDSEIEISICIANFNGINTIERCLISALSQSNDINIEILVHDDASTDSSCDYIKTHFPNVTLIKSQKNVGYCISNNRLVNASNGKYILLLNNDAFLRANALITLYNYAEDNRYSGILSLPQYSALTSDILDYGFDLDLFYNPIPRMSFKSSSTSMVMGSCLWIPRELWGALGGFPEWFVSNAEDMYLCLFAWYSGTTVKIIPESGYDHMVGQSFGGGIVNNSKLSTTYFRRQLSEQNKSYNMCLFTPMPILFFLLPAHIIFLCIEGTLISLVKKDKKVWLTIYWATLKSLFHQRSKIIEQRKVIYTKAQHPAKTFANLIKLYPYKLVMLLKYGFPTIGDR